MDEYNIKNPDLIIRISITGDYPENAHNRETVLAKIDRILKDTLKHASQYANDDYGFTNQYPVIQFLSSPLLIDQKLLSTLEQRYSDHKFIIVTDHDMGDPNILPSQELSFLGTDPYSGQLSQKLIFSWICDQSDFGIMVNQTENPLFHEYIKHCRYEAVPTVSIFASPERHMLWTAASYFDSYNNDKLEEYLDSLFQSNSTLPKPENHKKMLKRKLLWGNLFSRYMEKNKVKVTHHANTEDSIIDSNYNLLNISEEAEEVKCKLLDIYHDYDDLAKLYAGKYRASIYLRAVVPLILTVFLAVGFYLNTLLKPFSFSIPGIGLSLWSVLAGLAFFASALLNLYMYTLSEDKTVQSWHKYFIDNRFIAEGLRLAIHFIPFGIPVNYILHTNRFGSKKINQKNSIQRLRSLFKHAGLPIITYDSKVSCSCLNSLEELINNQIAYHENTVAKYDGIIGKLKKYGKFVFYIGFLFILFRGCLQLFFGFIQFPQEINHVNGNDIKSLIQAISNMLALIFPAWAAYFSSKLTLCNFEGLHHNETRMVDELKAIKLLIHDENQKDMISYSDMYYLSKDIISVILGEYMEWYSQIYDKKVTKI